MPQNLLIGQLKEKPTYRVRCLYSSFVHDVARSPWRRFAPLICRRYLDQQSTISSESEGLIPPLSACVCSGPVYIGISRRHLVWSPVVLKVKVSQYFSVFFPLFLSLAFAHLYCCNSTEGKYSFMEDLYVQLHLHRFLWLSLNK